MDPIPCCCDTFFIPRNKQQQCCLKPACQKTRKALWQKQKLATDPEYKKGQRLANQKWSPTILVIGKTVAEEILKKPIGTGLCKE